MKKRNLVLVVLVLLSLSFVSAQLSCNQNEDCIGGICTTLLIDFKNILTDDITYPTRLQKISALASVLRDYFLAVESGVGESCAEEVTCIDGEAICSEGALFCSREGQLELLEDCQYGCEVNSCVVFDESPITGNCVEVIPEFNNQEDNRINVILIGFNYDNLEILSFLAEAVIDVDSNYFGLLSVEPFKSNKDKFNFWLVDKVQNLDDVRVLRKKLSSLPEICNYPNLYPVALINQVGGSKAGFVAIPDKEVVKGSFPNCETSDINGDHCIDDKDLIIIEEREDLNIEEFPQCYQAHYGCHFETIPTDDRVFYYTTELFVFVHEFGHSFGFLRDEYNYPGITDFKGDILKDNCFVAESQQECLTNTPWKDLLGKGCGDESIIDCSPDDENYSLEIGCFQGCNYETSGTYRPTLLSIMGGQDTAGLNVFSTKYSFRLVNERILCNRIVEVTGSTNGYCTSEFGIS